MMLISVKIWDPAMMLVTTRKNVTGRTIGKVMFRSRWNALAPSSAAASCRDAGTPWMAARYRSIEYPRPFQMAMMMIAGLTVAVFCSQSGPSIPNQASTWLIRPKSPL